jgi:hypothetical protein
VTKPCIIGGSLSETNRPYLFPESMFYAHPCKALQTVQNSLIPTFTAITRVQIPSGTPIRISTLKDSRTSSSAPGDSARTPAVQRNLFKCTLAAGWTSPSPALTDSVCSNPFVNQAKRFAGIEVRAYLGSSCGLPRQV